jgi:uncharacterized membrane protein YdbT with pleckstrin-like domain
MGRYIDENLAKDETLIYETKLHWVIFVWAGFWLLLSLTSLLICLLLGLSSFFAGKVLFIVSAFFFVLAAGLGILNYQDRESSEFAVTTKKVLIKTGVFSVKTLETQLDKISDISVNQGILERILGYGSVRVASTGGVQETYGRIENPIQFKRKIQEHIDGN